MLTLLIYLLVTIVSNEKGPANCWINQNARLSLWYVEAGQEVTYSLNPLNKYLFFFNISGSIPIADKLLEQRDSMGIWETSQLNINCQAESRFLIIEVPINHQNKSIWKIEY